MRIDRPLPEEPEVPLTALIDVVFILLIFVVLVARFSAVDAMGLDVPDAASGTRAPLDRVVARVEADGTVRLAREEVPRGDVEARLRSACATPRPLVVVAAETTTLSQVVPVLDAGYAAGCAEVAIATEPP